MIKEKIRQAVSILREKGIDMWITFVRESGTMPDPSMEMVVGTSVTWQTAFIITAKGKTIAICGSLDAANLESKGCYDEIVGYVQSIKELLLEVIERHNPAKIAINYSTDSVLADGLTHGMYLNLLKYLEGTRYAERLVSSADVLAALRGRKSETELRLMKNAIRITLKILDMAGTVLKPGRTERDVAEFIKKETKKAGADLAWDPEYCPSVFTGPESAGAHAGPTKRKIEQGHVLNIDFGVRRDGYCSDLQRTWYFLRKGEPKPPEEVERAFNAIVTAIELGSEKLAPGVMGWEVDEAARGYLTGLGYDEYPHALGHQIGKLAHDGSGLLCPKWERYGTLPYQKVERGQVYTIEPRVTIEDYGVATVEEEVVVLDKGCEFLSKPQKKIFLVK